MDQNTLTAHETTELHEMIKSLTTEVRLLQHYSHNAKETQLKSYIINSIAAKQSQLSDLEQFIRTKGILQ